MSLRQSRRQLCHISSFGLLDSRACHLSIHLINKAEGSFSFFSFVPLHIVLFLASPERWSFAAAVDLRICPNKGRCITLIVPEKPRCSSAVPSTSVSPFSLSPDSPLGFRCSSEFIKAPTLFVLVRRSSFGSDISCAVVVVVPFSSLEHPLRIEKLIWIRRTAEAPVFYVWIYSCFLPRHRSEFILPVCEICFPSLRYFRYVSSIPK
jgi:hypothetical protein